MTEEAKLVIVDWNDLIAGRSIHTLIEEAYGPNGMGIIGIQNVPDFVQHKDAVLRLAHRLASLPTEYLEGELTDAKTLYNAGWSHGKEKMGDKPDTAKASFYFNPITDFPGTPEDRKQYPLSYPTNVWPDEARIPGFRDACCSLGKILTEACVVLSAHLDSYVASKVPSYTPPNLLHGALNGTEKVKARLLYYYPLEAKSASEDSWIGWHNDSGFLTALAGDLFLENGNPLPSSPDPDAGLYVVTRENQVQKVVIPSDCLAIQVGECAQIVTHAALQATPHCVRGAPGIARTSLACFVDVPPQFPLHGDISNAASNQRVPPLTDRWIPGMKFGDFLSNTFQKYYEWNTKQS